LKQIVQTNSDVEVVNKNNVIEVNNVKNIINNLEKVDPEINKDMKRNVDSICQNISTNSENGPVRKRLCKEKSKIIMNHTIYGNVEVKEKKRKIYEGEELKKIVFQKPYWQKAEEIISNGMKIKFYQHDSKFKKKLRSHVLNHVKPE